VSDEKITKVKVRNEHLREVNPAAHWAYLFGVLMGGLLLMVLLMALLGASTS
jgi:hypothetical protein